MFTVYLGSYKNHHVTSYTSDTYPDVCAIEKILITMCGDDYHYYAILVSVDRAGVHWLDIKEEYML